MEMAHRLEKGRLRVCCLIASLVTISGLFQPWLWRGYDSYSEFNPRTRKPETHYHVVTTVSPLHTSIFRDGKLVMAKWFMDLETSFAGAVLVSAALLSIFRYDRSWFKILLSLTCFIACVFARAREPGAP